MTKGRTGTLADILGDAMDDTGLSMRDLTVLSPNNDPYRLGTDERHIEGRWLAEQLALVVPDGRRVHLRGLHYRLVAHGGILKPDGTLYRNDDDDWSWLQNDPAKAARWLGYVPFDRVRDERNSPPLIRTPYEPPPPVAYLSEPEASDISLDDIELARPEFWLEVKFEGRQPYRIILFGEKSSLEDVLFPLAQAYGTELILPNGEPTDTLVYEMAARADRDDRPAVVLYFSDFDPSGWQMPISVARKLQALRHLEFPELDIRVYRVALTIEQVKTYDLPSTPLKATEGRAGDWYAEWGHEQTEIDALAALQPALLEDIAIKAIHQFYDTTLAERVAEAERNWLAEADERLGEHPEYENVMLAIENAEEEIHQILEAARDELSAVQTSLKEDIEGQLDDIKPPEIVVPEAMIDEEAQPRAWYDSKDEFVKATKRLIGIKAYDPRALGRRVRINDDDDC